MSQSTDPDHFFQTDDSIAETNRKTVKSKNSNGSPIRLPSKILAIIADPTDAGRVYVAEAAGTARRVVLETSSKTHIYRGPTAPLTCLALSPSATTLFAGCWDKSIWSWDTNTRTPGRRYTGVHTDFVKAVLCFRLGGKDFLISGGADASIIIWGVPSGAKLHTLKGGHSMGIQHLVLDPVTYPPQSELSAINFFSAGSDRTIRRWAVVPIPHAGNELFPLFSASLLDPSDPIIAHETSVYKLVFDSDDDLWTASADGTVKCLSRDRAWEEDTVLQHGDFVRGLGITDNSMGDNWVITGGRNEEIKVWNKSTGTLHHIFSGHYDEITDLVVVGQKAVSVSIDGTIRRWSLKGDDLKKARLEAEGVGEEGEEEVGVGQGVEEVEEEGEGVGREVQEGKVLMTEEEERELAELMEDSD